MPPAAPPFNRPSYTPRPLTCTVLENRVSLKAFLMSEKPRCPRCGKADEVRTFAELYAFELHSSPKVSGLNPFNLFTTPSEGGNSNGGPTVDLAGGCLTAVVGLVTIPLRGWNGAKTAARRQQQEREGKAERLKRRETLAAWPAIFACKRDKVAFLPGAGRGAPAPSVFLMLREGRGGAAVADKLRGG